MALMNNPELLSRMAESMSVANNILAVHLPRLCTMHAALGGIHEEPSRAHLASSSPAAALGDDNASSRVIRETVAGLAHTFVHLHTAAHYLSSVLSITLRHGHATFSSALPSLADKPFAELATGVLLSIPPPVATPMAIDDALCTVGVVYNSLTLLLDYFLHKCLIYLRGVGRVTDPDQNRDNRLPLAREKLRSACNMLAFAARHCNVAANAIRVHDEASLIHSYPLTLTTTTSP